MAASNSRTTAEKRKPKKNLLIKNAHNTRFYEIVWEDGGVVPNVLKGYYTDTKTAQAAINTYIGK